MQVGVDRPRVVLVLGAGGSVGHAFHLGVLSALLDELGWDARAAGLIVGTSAGSVVARGLRAGIGPAECEHARGAGPSPTGGLLRRRGGDRRLHGEQAIGRVATAAAGTTCPDERAARLRRLKMASPERVRRALREPWRVTPGSLLSAMIPPGRLPTDHLGAPYDALFGADWPDDPLWVVAVTARRRDPGGVRPGPASRRTSAPIGTGRAGVVRGAGLLRAGRRRRRAVRRRRRALDHQRRSRGARRRRRRLGDEDPVPTS